MKDLHTPFIPLTFTTGLGWRAGCNNQSFYKNKLLTIPEGPFFNIYQPLSTFKHLKNNASFKKLIKPSPL